MPTKQCGLLGGKAPDRCGRVFGLVSHRTCLGPGRRASLRARARAQRATLPGLGFWHQSEPRNAASDTGRLLSQGNPELCREAPVGSDQPSVERQSEHMEPCPVSTTKSSTMLPTKASRRPSTRKGTNLPQTTSWESPDRRSTDRRRKCQSAPRSGSLDSRRRAGPALRKRRMPGRGDGWWDRHASTNGDARHRQRTHVGE